ncbi:MAG: S-layer homology domain-containing protein [Clostridia bacterium]|nr:S-layer homology domain-containing protein [Clostridia bacterium]
MKYLKLASIFMFFVLIFASFAITSSADSSAPLSPALAVIAQDMQMKKCGLSNTPLHLTKSDFEAFFAVDELKAITVSALPSAYEGTLYLGSAPVIANQRIYRNDLNKLRFEPASSEVQTASFRFYGNGLSIESSVKCSLYLLDEINTAPVITQDVINSEKVTTQKNIMVYSVLSATDNEDDALSFEVFTAPTHGTVKFTDKENGVFSYTPAFDYVGNDSFEFVVRDIYGNCSEKAKVSIKIEKNTSNAFYSDMIGHPEHLDAVKAANYKIISGKLSDGEMCFYPDQMPTKAEFVRMALKAAGIKKELVSVDTGFTDDSDIPTDLKGYVAYATKAGYISGTKTDKGVFFYPNSTFTRAEAAVLLNNILNAECASKTITFNDSEDIPSWATEDVQTLAELKIIESLGGNNYYPNEYITNAQAAKILCRFYEINKK